MKFLDITGVQILWNKLKSKFFNILNTTNYYNIMNSNAILNNFPSNTVVRKVCDIDDFASYYIIIVNNTKNRTSAYIYNEGIDNSTIPMTTVIDNKIIHTRGFMDATEIYTYAFIVLPNVDKKPKALTNETWTYVEIK